MQGSFAVVLHSRLEQPMEERLKEEWGVLFAESLLFTSKDGKAA